MAYGICHLSVIAGRAEPSDRSEMVTQLLFGERFEVLNDKDQWVSIQTIDDHYNCWIDSKQHYKITNDFNTMLDNDRKVFVLNGGLHKANDELYFQFLLPGSYLPLYDGSRCYLNDEEYTFSGEVAEVAVHIGKTIQQLAFLFLNAPYLWGGRSLYGIDCSGFVQVVFRMAGIQLPRDSSQQAEKGEVIESASESQLGDLGFFKNTEGEITHVGILLGEGFIIHASGKVRIDKLDEKGILNVDTGQYSHELSIIKRVV